MPFSNEVLLIIAIALFFDFSNGFHDAANSSRPWSARACCARIAVVWAAFFNFVAFAIFGVHVARTIARHRGPGDRNARIVLAALSAALAWNLLTGGWAADLLVARADRGFVGAAWPRRSIVILMSGVTKVALFIVLSPLFGWCSASSRWSVSWIFWRSTPARVDSLFRRLQLVSARPSASDTAPTTRRRRRHHRRCSIRPGISPALPRADVGDPRDYGAIGSARWRRLAHRQDHGDEHHEAQPVAASAPRPPARSRCSRQRRGHPGLDDAHITGAIVGWAPRAALGGQVGVAAASCGRGC